MRIDPKLLDDGMSPVEIAEELGLTTSNVHSIIQRALTKMRLNMIARGVNKKDYIDEDFKQDY